MSPRSGSWITGALTLPGKEGVREISNPRSMRAAPATEQPGDLSQRTSRYGKGGTHPDQEQTWSREERPIERDGRLKKGNAISRPGSGKEGSERRGRQSRQRLCPGTVSEGGHGHGGQGASRLSMRRR